MSDVKMCLYPQCNAPLPKGANKYCPGTDHYQQHMRLKRQLSQQRQVEERKLTVASKKVTTTTTEEMFASTEERQVYERVEMHFNDIQEQLQQARIESEKESAADKFESWSTRYGSMAIPALLVFAVGSDIGQFLFTKGADHSWYTAVPVIAIAVLFECVLALLTYNLRGLRRDLALAPETAKPSIEADYKRARTGWFILAVVSVIAQVVAITGGVLPSLLIAIVVAIRAIGTTGADYAIAVCIAPRVKTTSMRVAELKQEANDLRELAGAWKEKLLADREVRQTLLEVASPLTTVEEVQS